MAIKKIVKTDYRINPFGGIHFVVDAIERKKIASIIDKHLGSRPKQAGFSFSDIFLSWNYSNFCGADRLEDTQALKTWLKHLPSLGYPSPDTIGRVLRSLAAPTTRYNDSGVVHEFSINPALNSMMVDIALRLSMINKCNSNTLDYDNTIIYTKKKDCRATYMKELGYQPGVCFIGRVPVFIENRNGNSNAIYRIHDTLARSFALLKEKGIKVGRLRSDAGGYRREVLDIADKAGAEIFVRMRHSLEFSALCDDIPEDQWQTVKIGDIVQDLSSVEFTPFKTRKGKNRSYRAVVKREIVNGYYEYFSVLTSNRHMTNRQVIIFYNQRGAIERNFDELKNSFNWGSIPFSNMSENGVFLVAGAISYIMFQYIIRNFSKAVSFVGKKFRLKRFILHFITVAVIWDASSEILSINSEKDYGALLYPS